MIETMNGLYSVAIAEMNLSRVCYESILPLHGILVVLDIQ